MEDKLVGNGSTVVYIWGKEWKCECMGCAIVNHEIDVPGGFVYEDDKFTIQQDPAIPIDGFIIINLKKHLNSITLLSEVERNQMMNLMNKVVTYLKDLNIAKEVTIVQEERCEHLHVWIFPYHSWMDSYFGRGVSYIRDIAHFAKENATKEDKLKILETVIKLKEKFANFK